MQSKQNWPFNGKSLWSSLPIGSKVAAIAGIPIVFSMMTGFHELTNWMCFPVRILFDFIGFFLIPWIYVRGIGMVIAVIGGSVLNNRK